MRGVNMASASTLSLLLHLLLVVMASRSVQATPAVTPVHQAVERGEQAIFECSGLENITESSVIYWYFTPSGTIDNSSSSGSGSSFGLVIIDSSKVQVVNMTLTISNTSKMDAGRYRCQVEDGAMASDATLIVYDMPSYVLEWIVVGSLCSALLIILVVAVVINNKYEEKRRKLELLRNKDRLRSSMSSVISF